MKIRLFKPCVGQEELDSIRQVFDRSWLGLGPTVTQFEQEWNEYIQAEQSIAVNSCTAALHLALSVYGFPPGSEVLLPAISFVATATAVLYNQLVPVFVDVDPHSLSICLKDLERKLTSKSVAVIPVHLGGHPVPMDALMELAEVHSLKVIEDCANCAGGSYQGKKLGTWGDIGCFSFEEKKNMTTGDGGMISSKWPSLIDPLRANRWVGIDKDTWRRTTDNATMPPAAYHWHYEVATLGYKYNMNDLMASIGIVQLKKLDWMNHRRASLIERYLQGIADMKTFQPLYPYSLNDSAYWIFGIRCSCRDDLIIFLQERGISTGVHFFPLPFHPLFKGYESTIPVAASEWKRMVTLPLFPDLEDREVDYVLEALADFDSRQT